MTEETSLTDSLGIDYEVPDGAFLVGGCVVLKVLGPDGVVQLVTRWSEGVNWIEKIGMLRYAEKYESKWIDDDDD